MKDLGKFIPDAFDGEEVPVQAMIPKDLKTAVENSMGNMSWKALVTGLLKAYVEHARKGSKKGVRK